MIRWSGPVPCHAFLSASGNQRSRRLGGVGGEGGGVLLGLFRSTRPVLGFKASKAEPTPYAVLGVSPSASSEAIKVAFKQKALLLHPDSNNISDAAVTAERFKQVSAAYQTLKDPAKKRHFDQTHPLYHSGPSSASSYSSHSNSAATSHAGSTTYPHHPQPHPHHHHHGDRKSSNNSSSSSSSSKQRNNQSKPISSAHYTSSSSSATGDQSKYYYSRGTPGNAKQNHCSNSHHCSHYSPCSAERRTFSRKKAIHDAGAQHSTIIESSTETEMPHQTDEGPVGEIENASSQQLPEEREHHQETEATTNGRLAKKGSLQSLWKQQVLRLRSLLLHLWESGRNGR